ncbi:MAG: ABC transporter ATP-binding protein [Gemmatimonadaceae bacterium]
MSDSALALEAIDKRFGEVQALRGASLNVRRGTLHAVLGENGAGKTTLMRIAFGLMPADAGSVRINGAPVTLTSGADAIRRGLGMVHQHFTLVLAMTAAENIALGGHGRLALRAVAARVQALVERTGLRVDPTARIATLGVGAQQRVEILKALYSNARVLILDEPTAVLTPTEAEELFAWLRRFVSEGGTAVLVTHKLQEALAVADDVTVLRRGQCVLTAPSAQLDMTALVRAVTGDDAELSNTSSAVIAPARQVPQRGACVARLDAVSARDARGVERVRDATVDCFAGEIIGLAGVEGSGVHELLRLLAGRLAPSSGVATLPPRIGFIPEDRLRDAVIEEFTLTENVALRGAGARRGRMPWPALQALTTGLMERHDVRAPSPATRAGTLSGGNQQKFVVGRELDEHPALVVAENPVRGLDIRATAHVLRELAGSASEGSAVVFYSADIDELLPIADRMLVVFAGRVREVAVERVAVANALVGAA